MSGTTLTTDRTFASPVGPLTLERFPRPPARGREQSLRAWDAADALLLTELIGPSWPASPAPATDRTVALVNDSFGALTCGARLAGHKAPVRWSDSVLADTACRHNLAANGLDDGDTVIWSTGLDAPPQHYDLVLVRVPKSLALLEDQLYRLRAHLDAGSLLIAGGMVKHLPRSVGPLMEQILGPTEVARAQGKARLIRCRPDPAGQQGASPHPSWLTVVLGGETVSLHNHANVFSRDQLDIGTRFLLDHLPEVQAGTDVVDLGCGNGVVGLAIARRQPAVNLTLTDESHMAVASARVNLGRYAPDTTCRFVACHSLQPLPADSADLVVSNPPFHQQHVVGDHIARAMFADAKRVLRPGGELLVVGNRHLDYHIKLRRLFGNCATVAANPKFVVLSARA